MSEKGRIDCYRYGFNGQEKDDEIYGAGNSTTAEFWQYDSRLGRRWNLDPKPNPEISDYACFANNPIWFSDPDGDTIKIVGSKQFERQVTREIRKLMRTDEGRNLVKSLHERKEIVTIYQTTGGNETNVQTTNSSNQSDLLNVVPNTIINPGDIFFNPSSSEGGFNTTGDRSRPSYIGLGHEMKHSQEINDKTINWGSWTAPDGINVPMYEISAVDSENKVRKQSGNFLRTSYYTNNGGEGLLLEHNKKVSRGTHPLYNTDYKSMSKYKTRISLKSTKIYLQDAGATSWGIYKNSKRIHIAKMGYVKK